MLLPRPVVLTVSICGKIGTKRQDIARNTLVVTKAGIRWANDQDEKQTK